MYALVEHDTIKSIQQNIRLILTTPKGSDVHRLNFGSDLWKSIDQPHTFDIVIPKGTRATAD